MPKYGIYYMQGASTDARPTGQRPVEMPEEKKRHFPIKQGQPFLITYVREGE